MKLMPVFVQVIKEYVVTILLIEDVKAQQQMN
jgi:hypothetical protein